MDKLEIFRMLGIKETMNKELIKNAYRTLLVDMNPEDEPEKFKRLRMAYEEAIRLCDTKEELAQKEEQTELERWLCRVESCYQVLQSRISLDSWKDLLSDDLCIDLDTVLETRNALIGFLMGHYRLPQEVFQYIDEVFMITDDIEELKEEFPKNFLDYFIYSMHNKIFFDLSLFSGTGEGQYDEFINEYFDIKDKLEEDDLKEIDDLFDKIERFSLYHPYVDVERLRLMLKRGEELDWNIIEKLSSEYGDNLYVRYYIMTCKWEAGEFDTAYEDITMILEQSPEHYGALAKKAEYDTNNERYEDSKEICKQLLNVNSGDESIRKLYEKNNTFLICQCEEKLKENPKDIENILELAWMYLENLETEQCMNLLNGMEPDKEHSMEYYQIHGRNYFSMDEYEKAIRYLQLWYSEIAKIEDDGSDTYKEHQDDAVLAKYWQGRAFKALADECGEERTPEKEEYFKKSLEVMNFDLDLCNTVKTQLHCHFLKAEVFYELSLYDECIETCKRMIEIQNDYFFAYVIMQKAYDKKGDAGKVIEILYDAVEIYALYDKIYIAAIKVYLHYKRYSDAKNIVSMARYHGVKSIDLDFYELQILRYLAEMNEEHLALIPMYDTLLERLCEEEPEEFEKRELYAEKIYNFMDLEDYEKALSEINHALSVCEEDVFFNRIKAEILFEQKDYQGSLNLYLEYMNEQENDYYYYYIGLCYQNLEKYDEALKFYDKVLQVNPNHGSVYYLMSGIYFDKLDNRWERNEFDLAVEYGLKQLKNREFCNAYVRMGDIYRYGYLFDEAVAMYRKALGYQPEDAILYNRLGLAYHYDGNFEEAIQCYQKEIELDTEKKLRYPYYNLGNVYTMMKEYDKAYETYMKAYELIPDLKWHSEIEEVLKRAGRYHDAIQYYETLLNTGIEKESFVYEQLGDIYDAMDEYETAKMYYNKSLEFARNDVEVICKIGKIYLYRENNCDRALKLFHHAYTVSESNRSSIKFSNVCVELMQYHYFFSDKEKAKEYLTESLQYYERDGKIDQYIENPKFRMARIYGIFQRYFFAGYRKEAEYYAGLMRDDYKCDICTYGKCVEAHLVKGYLLYDEGKLEEALNYFEIVQEEDRNKCGFIIERIKSVFH